jgi:hypothetical protein
LSILQTAAMFVASLLLAFVGAACVFKLAGEALVVAAGESLPSLGGDDAKPIWTWPRDRGKIAAYSLAVFIIGAVSFASSYFLAVRVFHPGS